MEVKNNFIINRCKHIIPSKKTILIASTSVLFLTITTLLIHVIKYSILAISFPDVKRKVLQFYPSECNYRLEVVDGTVLQGHYIQTNNKDVEVSEKKIFLLFNGNDRPASASVLHQWKNFHQSLYWDDAICFDYRGTFNSTLPFPTRWQLIEDGKAIVDHLISKGYAPENILISGYSFGGAIAPDVYTYLCEKTATFPPKLVLYHTFHRLDIGASQHIHNPFFKEALRIITKLGLLYLGWDYHFDTNLWEAHKADICIYNGGDKDTDISRALSLADRLQQIDPHQQNIQIREMPHTKVAHTSL